MTSESGTTTEYSAGDRAPRASSHRLSIAVHDRGDTSGTRIRAGAPGAVLSVVPLLLGFMPESSLVLIGTEQPRGTVKVTLRYDLPDPSDPDLVAEIAEHAVAILGSQQLSAAIAIGYGPDALVGPLATAFRDALAGGEPALIDFLRVEGDRYWSYTCTDQDCCPEDGVRFDPAEVPAALGDQVPVLASRAAVAASIAPVTGAAAEAMRQATRRAEQHVVQVIDKVMRSARLGAARNMIAGEGLAAVRDMIGCYRDGGQCADDYQVAWLTVALKDMRVRDDAWARMDPGYREAHRRLWSDVVRRAQPGHVAGPASLLAFVAWQSGDGALANLALDRALADDPDYSMATLLRQVISSGAPPSMARLPMTPEEVAACYEDLDETDDPDDETDEDEEDYDGEDYEEGGEDEQEEDEEYELLDGPCPVCDVKSDGPGRESADATV